MYKLLLLMLLSTFINAEWLVNNKIASNIDNVKSIKSLSVQLWLTDKESELISNWNTQSEKVILPSTNKIQVNKTLTSYVVFKGCKSDSQ